MTQARTHSVHRVRVPSIGRSILSGVVLYGWLSGCAAQPLIWQRTGAPPEQSEQDEARCRYQVEVTAGAPQYLSEDQARVRDDYRDTLQKQCMKALGYKQVPPPSPPPSDDEGESRRCPASP